MINSIQPPSDPNADQDIYQPIGRCEQSKWSLLDSWCVVLGGTLLGGAVSALLIHGANAEGLERCWKICKGCGLVCILATLAQFKHSWMLASLPQWDESDEEADRSFNLRVWFFYVPWVLLLTVFMAGDTVAERVTCLSVIGYLVSVCFVWQTRAQRA